MEDKKDSKQIGSGYTKLAIMQILSALIMYVIMFLNMDQFGHYHTSITRIYMAALMVTPMAVLMISMMGQMYPNRKINMGIVIFGIGLFIFALAGLRTQTPVGDIQYMKAMIPHHSSAIMVSRQADIKDSEVKKLSKKIIESQEREIADMERMIDRLTKE